LRRGQRHPRRGQRLAPPPLAHPQPPEGGDPEALRRGAGWGAGRIIARRDRAGGGWNRAARRRAGSAASTLAPARRIPHVGSSFHRPWPGVPPPWEGAGWGGGEDRRGAGAIVLRAGPPPVLPPVPTTAPPGGRDPRAVAYSTQALVVSLDAHPMTHV